MCGDRIKIRFAGDYCRLAIGKTASLRFVGISSRDHMALGGAYGDKPFYRISLRPGAKCNLHDKSSGSGGCV